MDSNAQMQHKVQALEAEVYKLQRAASAAEEQRSELRKLVASNKIMIDMVKQHDEAIQEEEVTRIGAIQFESHMTSGFLGKAIAIFVAWHLSKFFVVLGAWLLFSEDSDKMTELVLYTLWAVVMYGVSPCLYDVLRKGTTTVGEMVSLEDTNRKHTLVAHTQPPALLPPTPPHCTSLLTVDPLPGGGHLPLLEGYT